MKSFVLNPIYILRTIRNRETKQNNTKQQPMSMTYNVYNFKP